MTLNIDPNILDLVHPDLSATTAASICSSIDDMFQLNRFQFGQAACVGANPLSPPFPYVDLETRGFAVFLCFLVCILVKIDSR